MAQLGKLNSPKMVPIFVDSKNRGGSPKWMVKIIENPIKMDDLGGKPTIFGNIHICSFKYGSPVPSVLH